MFATLLNRIRILEEHPQARFDKVERTEIIISVVSYLNQLLNIRQGSAPAALGFGLPDLTDIPTELGAGRMEALQREIQGVIARYEPRLRNVEIKMLSEEDAKRGEFKFKLFADITDGTQAKMNLTIDSLGQVNISS